MNREILFWGLRIKSNEGAGLADKNGNKIFEGDIIKDRKEKVFEVKFKFKFGSFIANGKDFWTHIELSEDNYEVIGNIHENPELL